MLLEPTFRLPFRVRPANVGVAVELMFWIVLMTPDEAEKLVELKAAIPLVTPSAAALSIVTEPPEPEALFNVTAPV